MTILANRRLLLAFGFCLLTANAYAADDIRAGDLIISPGWSRATPAGAKVAGGYLTIKNNGTNPDTLKTGIADVSGKTEVHEMAVNNGVMTMRPLDAGLAIAPGQSVTLAPGGYHMMFLDLKQPLKQGDNFKVTLELEKVGKVVVLFSVQSVGARDMNSGQGAAPAAGSHATDHGKMQK